MFSNINNNDSLNSTVNSTTNNNRSYNYDAEHSRISTHSCVTADPASECSIASTLKENNSHASKNLVLFNESATGFLKQRLNKLSSSELILNRSKKSK
jgi:hypothetical protein